MNSASAWRLALARRLAPAYAASPKVKAVVVAGSVARGWADRHSDIEIDTFWAEPPSDDERRALVAQVGGERLRLHPYAEEEWSESYEVGGVKIELSQFLVATIERWLVDVIENCDTSPDKHMLLAAVQHAEPLHGNALIAAWQAKASLYPDALRRAVVSRHLDFDEAWYAVNMLAERDDVIFLYDIYCEIQKQLLGILSGLNRIYLWHPRGKWLDALVASMEVAPPALAPRLRRVFGAPPRTGVRLLTELLEETLALVETHLPEVDLAAVRALLGYQRRAWDEPPPGLGLKTGD